MEPHSQFISVDGVKLHVADWGGSGRDLLLLHAGGFLGRVYRAMIAKLVADYHILTMDLRGHGDSDKPAPDYYHWRYMARDVEGVIEHLGLRNFWLRRARRLLPALFLMLAAVSVWVAFFDTSQLAGVRRVCRQW